MCPEGIELEDLFGMLCHLVDRRFVNRHSVLDDPEHSTLTVLTT